MQHILSALHKFGDRIDNQELDKTLIHYLGSSSPLEKELARLILSGNLLFNFQNPELQDKVLDEIGKVINLDVIKPKHVHIGEEMHHEELDQSSIIITRYVVDKANYGIIGVVGPTRMNYTKLIAKLEYIAYLVGNKLNNILEG